MSEDEFNKYYNGLTQEEQLLVDAAIIKGDLMGEGSSEDDAVDEKQEVKAKLFKADAGWKKVKVSDRAVQIDDVLYEPGFLMSDFMKKVKSSSIKYEYDYNSKALVEGKKFSKLEIYRDGNEWFTIHVINLSEESANLKDCVVASIEVEDAAKLYCRYIDGRSYEDIMKMSVDEVKDLHSINRETRKRELYRFTFQY